MMRTLLAIGLSVMVFSGCLVVQEPYPAVAPGVWRGVLKLDASGRPPALLAGQTDDVEMHYGDIRSGELPFLFEVIYDSDSSFHIEIINGPERILIRDVAFGRSRERALDTLRIDFDIYETWISAFVEEKGMEGYWYVPTRGDYRIPFTAQHGKNYRFTTLNQPPALDLSGRWAATFTPEGEDPYPAIAEFQQQGNHLLGTFLTETGDYRFLEGTVQGERFYLSTFDGSHAFLFEGKIQPDSTLIGIFRSGKHYQSTWSARRDPDFQLGDPDTLTRLRGEVQTLDFAFPNPEGRLVSPNDPAYAGKVKIIQIMGTWCPNCRDETEFLVRFLKDNPREDLAVIALAFEKHRDPAKARAAIEKYRRHFGMNYEILHAGYYKKEEAVQALPMLEKIISYPTLIFLDRENRVRRIHTGFAGPATSAYDDFVEDFKAYVESLLAEQPAQ